MFFMFRNIAIMAAASAIVNASPMPQGVTSEVAPKAGPPSGCAISFPGTFGIAVMSLTAPAPSAIVTRQLDGQAGPSSSAPVTKTKTSSSIKTNTSKTSSTKSGAVLSQIKDGQPQAAPTARPLQQIQDGQVQHQTTVPPATRTTITIKPSTKTSVTSNTWATVAPITQIKDGQIQATTRTSVTSITRNTVAPITQIKDGQIQATYKPVTIKSTIISAVPVTAIKDGQPQAPTKASFVTSVKTSVTSVLVTPTATGKTSASLSKRSPQASTGLTNVACKSDSTLQLTLSGSNLLDAQGRTGYIASNYQFQFDKPAQAGAIYTSGFSICSNGSLALGGSTIFYQCRSGSFYNLYDRNWAPQCEPVTLSAVELQDC